MKQSKTLACVAMMAMLFLFTPVWAQTAFTQAKLPTKYEELSAIQFPKALEASKAVAIIPMGILEKHGPHLPLAVDLFDVREVSLRAVTKEYAIVFPPYYFGQIFEAKHQPGTIAYSPELIWKLLQETCDELGRNGIRKIILVNGHGGNNYFVRFFAQSQLQKKHNYAVFVIEPGADSADEAKLKALRKTTLDGHAGEEETSTTLVHHPELVHPELAKTQSGEDQKRLEHLQGLYTPIWWYAQFPNHYAGKGSINSKELGEAVLNAYAANLAKYIALVKDDKKVLELQDQFYRESENPLATGDLSH